MARGTGLEYVYDEQLIGAARPAYMNQIVHSQAKAVNFRVAAAILIVIACALAISTYNYFGHTWDEPEHIAAGMQLLDKDIYTYDIQHPPLARLAMAIGPYLAGARSFGEPGPSGEQEGRDLLYRTGKYDLLLTLARLGMLPFLIVLLGSTWLWAKRYYGLAEATLAVFFLVATPPILGHAAVAALDIPGAALCTLAFYLILRWFESGTWKFALAGGFASGLAIATKLSALPFIPLVALAWTLTWIWRRGRNTSSTLAHTARAAREQLRLRWWGQALCIAALALLCGMFSYGFSFRYIVTEQYPYNAALSYLFGASGWAHELTHAIARHIPLPVGFERLIWSIDALRHHNQAGHLSYLLGHFSTSGFRYFYVVALAVKTPLPLLLLGVGGLALLGKRAREKDWLHIAPLTAFLTLLAFCSFYSHINIGLRHVFVLYPLLAIAASVFSLHVWRRYRQLSVRAALIVLLVAQADALANSYPDYLAYFNVAAGRHPEKILIDSDLDWGQDLKRLDKRLNELHVTKFGFVYRGTADVVGERLPGVWMVQPFTPATGWIAASIYARETVSQGQAFAWLKRYQPLERIGKSIDLYYIPETTGPMTRARD